MTNFDNLIDYPKEFLETNIQSCYCSSTTIGYHSRKYHGLFVAPYNGQRFVLLSYLDLKVQYHNQVYSLSQFAQQQKTTQYKQIKISDHQLVPWPRFDYQLNNFKIRVEFLLADHHPGLWVCIHLLGDTEAVELNIRPLLAFRNHHDLSKKNNFVNQDIQQLDQKSFLVTPYEGLSSLYMQSNTINQFLPSFLWHEQYYYSQEAARGYPAMEDLFSYGQFKCRLSVNKPLIFLFSTKEYTKEINDSFFKIKKEKHQQYQLNLKNENGLIHWSSKHFLIKTNQTTNIIAGFPWFSCWGRDSLIALPGLLLVNKQYKQAKDLLQAYASQMKDGCVPNTLNTMGKAESYNSVDSTFWFVWALSQYWKHTKNKDHIYDLWNYIESIYEHIINKSHPLIHCDQYGLLHAGSMDTQLTWMDAKTDQGPVTPRFGCPIEMNALWFHLLAFMYEMAACFNKKYAQLESLLTKVQKNILAFYWLEQEQYFADFFYVKNNKRIYNIQLRPNQCIAIALLKLPKQKAQKALKQVYKHLWTPYGLRTLSETDPMFKAIYQGNQNTRDQAYHNGIVWPWLLGFYTQAVCRYLPELRTTAQQTLSNLKQFAAFQQTGFIPEIFDAVSPFKARGCIHQAWSVAELLRSDYLLKIDFYK